MIRPYTNDGEPIGFQIEEDVERENRGWVIDKITAYVNGVPVGYLKVSHIPKENFKRYYKSIYSFLDQIGGHYLIPREAVQDRFHASRDFDYKTLSEEHLRKLLYNVVFRFKELDVPWNTEKEYVANFPDRKSLLAKLKELEGILKNTTKGKQFKEFKLYQSRPFIDFIRVYEEYRGQGIAEALYLVSTNWVNESKGLNLHSSTLQSPEAQAVWKRLESKYDVRKCRGLHKGRRFIVF